MQVAPCGHQCQCRLCFVHTIKQAVASRDLPLKCLICNAKILKVKNNAKLVVVHQQPPHHQTITKENTIQNYDHDPTNAASLLPKSVSGYSIIADNEKESSAAGMAHSASNYSMSSGKIKKKAQTKCEV